MTNEEKARILSLRESGLGYKKIAVLLNLPVNGVKTFCYRHPIKSNPRGEAQRVCLHCGIPIIQLPHKKEKRFCTDKCRLTWWNRHPEEVHRKAFVMHTCPACGKQFEGYGHRKRVYCSRTCYANARRKAVQPDG